MRVEFYNTKQRKELLENFKERFGIKEIPRTLFETGKEKIRGFSGDLTIDEIYTLDKLTNIEFIGIYVFKKELGEMRLGFDGTILLKDQISKNIIEINKEELEKWMTGQHLEIVREKGMYVVKHESDVFGCGFSDGKKIINFVPKERRIRRS